MPERKSLAEIPAKDLAALQEAVQGEKGRKSELPKPPPSLAEGEQPDNASAPKPRRRRNVARAIHPVPDPEQRATRSLNIEVSSEFFLHVKYAHAMVQVSENKKISFREFVAELVRAGLKAKGLASMPQPEKAANS